MKKKRSSQISCTSTFRPRLTSLMLSVALLTACGEHSGKNIQNFTGEYRYKSGIGQFFDCASAKSYYVFDSSAHKNLQSAYLALELAQADDAYVHIEGYLELVPQMEGIDPAMEFVPSKLISIDPSRGCTQNTRQGG